MDRQERLSGDDAYKAALLAALDGRQADIWTALPGIIESYDADAQTAVVQPAIMGKQLAPDGTVTDITMPLCLDVPVQFPRGGGVVLTFAVAKGDECLIHFSSRCIDAWWQSGNVQQQMELRMHDLSDGFAALGYVSQPRRLESVSTTSAQLRSVDGTTLVDLDPEGQTIEVTAPKGLTINVLSGIATVNAQDVVVHGSHSHSWDVDGYGERVTHTGGSNFTIDNYKNGAVVASNDLAWTPPALPPP